MGPTTQPAIRASAAAAAAPDCARDGKFIQRSPAVAFGAGAYLVVWSDGSRQVERPTADIYCATVRTGKLLDPAGILVCGAPDLQEAPAVAFDGTSFLVAWQDLRGGKDYDVYAARVSLAGKVLDPGGFAVAAGPGNQSRPAVAFAGGNFLIAWMDARQYPVYGLYGARVSPEGKVLDEGGKVLDAEKPEAIAKVRPPGGSWLGDRHYWWDRLSSRFQPVAAGRGGQCLITYLRDVHANRMTGWALRVDGRTGEPAGPPVQVPGEPRDRLAACPTPDGWAVAFDHWLAGWSPAPRLAALRLDEAGKPRDAVPERLESQKPPPPTDMMLDLQKSVAGSEGEYQQGKGHFTFWQAAVAPAGGGLIVVSDYGWRMKRKPAELHYAIVAGRYDLAAGRFLDEPPTVLASASTTDGTCVRNPAIAAGPDGEALVVYESDAGADKLIIESRLLRAAVVRFSSTLPLTRAIRVMDRE